MTHTITILVKREAITEARARKEDVEGPGPGQVLVAIDKFALTANNVTYAVAGDMIGYWSFYPAEAPWGIVPVWGVGEVIASGHGEVSVGERLYGFFPMASHALLTPGELTPQQFMEASEHRAELPAVYNSYRRIASEPDFLQAMEEERCLYFPLFMTSYLIYDFLIDNALFGARQVVIGSASSKTAFGLASLLHRDSDCDARIVGLTSVANQSFVESLGYYDHVVCYGEETAIDSDTVTVFVDMSGDSALTARVHGLLESRLAYSCAVGATHWENFGTPEGLPGPAPEFFFAPAQIAKREEEWGRGVILNRAAEAVADIVRSIAGEVEIQRIKNPDAAIAAWVDLVENRVPPDRGLLLSLLP